MNWLFEHYTEVLAAIGAVITAASMIVVLTPSTKDDEILGKVIRFLEMFSIFNKRTPS
ncbi:MAG: hypothetical protein AB7G80_09030 [Dongiaceae bacterium]